MAEIGDGAGSDYPAVIATNSTPEVNDPSPSRTLARAEVVEDLAAEVIATQSTLGTNPQGSLADVKTYLQTQHGTDGSHDATSVVMLAGAQTIAGNKSFTGLAMGVPMLRGFSNLKCATYATTMTITADYVMAAKVASPYNTYYKYISGTTYTINTATTGANGKDAALTTSAWTYAYIIIKSSDGTTAGIVSSVGPLTGPTMPTDYDMWAFATATYWNGSNNFVLCRTMGNQVYYLVPTAALTDGAAETATAIALAAFVPPNATEVLTHHDLFNNSAGTRTATLQHVTGSNFIDLGTLTASSNDHNAGQVRIPLTTAQTIYYICSGANVQLDINVAGFVISNGSR